MPGRHRIKQFIETKKIYPAGIYLLKVNNRNTKTKCEISSKLIINRPERRHWRNFKLWTSFTPCSSVSIVNFEQVIAGRAVESKMTVLFSSELLWKSKCEMIWYGEISFSVPSQTPLTLKIGKKGFLNMDMQHIIWKKIFCKFEIAIETWFKCHFQVSYVPFSETKLDPKPYPLNFQISNKISNKKVFLKKM